MKTRAKIVLFVFIFLILLVCSVWLIAIEYGVNLANSSVMVLTLCSTMLNSALLGFVAINLESPNEKNHEKGVKKMTDPNFNVSVQKHGNTSDKGAENMKTQKEIEQTVEPPMLDGQISLDDIIANADDSTYGKPIDEYKVQS